MINIFDKRKNLSYFETIDEYTNYLEETDSLRYGASDDNDYEFSGTRSLKEALKLCKYGDEELRKYIQEQTSQLDDVDTVNKIRRSTVNDVVGFIPNVPNYVIGVPNNMIRDNRNIIKSKIVNIFINISAPCHVDKKYIQRNAAMFVSAINKLEEQGYRCNVYSGSVGENSYKEIENMLVVKVKSDREPLNLAKMAFPLAHPSMLRRLKFKWMETIPLDFGSGYGSTISNEDRIHELLNMFFKDTKFTILCVSNSYGDTNKVIEKLKKKGDKNESN